MPAAFVGGVSIVIAIYVLMTLTSIAVIPLGQLTSSTGFRRAVRRSAVW